jgi:hypothetical protein
MDTVMGTKTNKATSLVKNIESKRVSTTEKRKKVLLLLKFWSIVNDILSIPPEDKRAALTTIKDASIQIVYQSMSPDTNILLTAIDNMI